MQFNEFNRRLDECSMDPKAKLLFAHLFETQMELYNTVDEVLTVLHALADSVSGLTALHESTQERVKALTQNRHAEVRSVRDEEF